MIWKLYRTSPKKALIIGAILSLILAMGMEWGDSECGGDVSRMNTRNSNSTW